MPSPQERKQLRPLVALADWVIDTSQLNVHQLRKRVLDEVQGHAKNSVSLLFESFAYKKGVPGDADFVFDARCLPNPHWIPALRPLSGKDQAVQDFFDGRRDVQRLPDTGHGFHRHLAAALRSPKPAAT